MKPSYFNLYHGTIMKWDAPSRRTILAFFVLGSAYFAATLVGAMLFRYPAVVFPAAGIALAGLVIGGIRVWPAVFFGSLAAHAFLGTPPIWVLTLTVANTMQAVTAATLLQFIGFDAVFRRVRDMLAYMAVVAAATTITPSIGVLIATLVDGNARAPSWGIWWIGVLMPSLVFGSVIIRWLAKPHFTRTAKEIVEIILVIFVITVLSYLVYWTRLSEATRGLLILVYLAPFVWVTLGLGMRFTLLAFAITSLFGLTGVFYGDVDTTRDISTRIVTVEVWLAALASIFYLFVAMVEERQRAARELNEQLERVNTLLQETKRQDRAKTDFIAVFAHELRNPLAPIVSSLELLRLKRIPPHELDAIIASLDERVRTIVRLLDDLLDISRISAGKLRLRREVIDAGTIVRRAASTAEPHMRRRNQTLHVAIPEAEQWIDVDPVRIEQIVSNLLSNASKFTPDGGHISMTVAPGDPVQIIVRDTGVGIDPTMLPRIFEPFLQIETEHRTNEGLGIGLSLTERLVRVHGGNITAESKGPGHGSTFTVHLPAATRTTSPLRQTPMETIAPPQRILIVDDNEAAAHSLGTLLTYAGHTVTFAYTGAEAERVWQSSAPDSIILDIGLPDSTGYVVATHLRAAGFTKRLIALTGYGQDDDKKKALEAGFSYHLTKPVTLADVQKALMS